MKLNSTGILSVIIFHTTLFAFCAATSDEAFLASCGSSAIPLKEFLSKPQQPFSADSATTQAESISKAVKILSNNGCVDCHSKGSTIGSPVFDDILDFRELRLLRFFEGKDSKDSRFIRSLTRTEKSMPLGGDRLSEENVDSLKQWVTLGALSENEIQTAEPSQSTISDRNITKCIELDYAQFPLQDQPNVHYLTFKNFYDPTNPEKLRKAHQAVFKLLNSLSWNEEITSPYVVDSLGLTVRFSWKDFAKTVFLDRPNDFWVDAWLNHFEGALSVPAETFLRKASQPPAYYEFLGVVERFSGYTDTETYHPFFTFDRNYFSGVIGLKESGVSRNNRIITRSNALSRHEASQFYRLMSRYFWTSYDFASSRGSANISENPDTFVHDGGEVIFSLPNGLHGYLIIDNRGNRLNEAPTNIVRDPQNTHNNHAVVNGVSCMRCHSGGLIPKTDEIYFPGNSEKRKEMENYFLEDNKSYHAALAQLGIDPSEPDPVSEIVFDQESLDQESPKFLRPNPRSVVVDLETPPSGVEISSITSKSHIGFYLGNRSPNAEIRILGSGYAEFVVPGDWVWYDKRESTKTYNFLMTVKGTAANGGFYEKRIHLRNARAGTQVKLPLDQLLEGF